MRIESINKFNPYALLQILGLITIMLFIPKIANAKSSANENILVKSGLAKIVDKGVLVKRNSKANYNSQVSEVKNLQKVEKVSKNQQILRKKMPLQSTQAFGFSVYDANVLLLDDRDLDGYYSEFELNFDVDYDNGPATVYAKIYYRTSAGDWIWFYTTDDFDINGNASSDSYSVISTLSTRFPSDEYDFLIDIYEAGVPGIVDTYSSSIDSDLMNVPLEDTGYDSAINQDLNLISLSFNSFGDDDFDGFYYNFNLVARVKNDSFDRRLQAKIYTRDSVSGWSLEHTTASVWVNFNESVKFDVDGLWSTGYASDYYDFLIEVIDVDSGEIVVDYGPEYEVLSQQALESQNLDRPNDVVVVVDEGYSSGSSGLTMILGLLLFSILRRKQLSLKRFA